MASLSVISWRDIPAQVVVKAAKPFELDRETGVSHREPVNLPPAGAVFF